MTQRTIAANPYAWPWNGDLRPDNTALIVIDMHTDFCGAGSYVDKMDYGISLTRAKATGQICRTYRTCRPTSAGAHARLAPTAWALARSAPAGAFW